VLVAPTADGAVAYDLDARRLHELNRTGAAVAAACAQGADLDDTVETWAAQTGADPTVIAHDVRVALDSFSRLGLVGDRPARELFLAEAVAPPAALGAGDTYCVVAAAEHRIRIAGDDPTVIDAIGEWFAVPTHRHDTAIRSNTAGSQDAVASLDEAAAHDEATGHDRWTIEQSGEDAPTAQFTIRTAADGTVSLSTDTTLSYPDAANLLDNFIGAFNHFVSRSATHVVLHAAALADTDGRVVVFPADRNAGKSTLAAALVQRGWTYLGDESAALNPATLEMLPCAKPLSLDATSRSVLELRDGLGDEVPLREVAAGAVAWSGPAPRPHRVIVPSYDPDAVPELHRVDGIDALVTLVRNTLNLFLVGADGLGALVELAAEVPVCRITYPDTASAIELVDRVLTDPTGS